MPKKTLGINYFPFDVDFFSDLKTKILRARYGNDGVMIYIYLLTVIYREGYYLKHTDDLEFIISDDLGISLDTVQQVMTFLLKRSMFNEQLFKSDAILTSDGIQKRWQEAVKVRAAKRPIEVGNYWLLPKEETTPHIKCTLFEINSENLTFNSENLTFNSENLTNKVKKSKVNESKVKITPNPLQGGGREELGEDWKENFFSTYTLFERKNYKDEGVDYKTLYQEFEKSSSLQRMWSFPKVVKLYPQIAKGDFRDKQTEQQQRINAADDRADRERYYSSLQAKAQSVVLENLKKAKSIPRFNEIEKALSGLEFKIAKAELYQPEQTETLEKEKNDLLEERRYCLRGIGLTEIDLIPKYRCSKCSDTGWLPNGRACDCYSNK